MLHRRNTKVVEIRTNFVPEECIINTTVLSTVTEFSYSSGFSAGSGVVMTRLFFKLWNLCVPKIIFHKKLAVIILYIYSRIFIKSLYLYLICI